MRVDLIRWPESSERSWIGGAELRLPPAPAEAAPALAAFLAGPRTEWVLFWDGNLGEPSLERLRPWMRSTVDGVHGGLRLGTGGQPEALDYVTVDWSWIDPSPHQAATSWRLSLRGALLRTDTLRRAGGLDPAFETLEGAGLELGYRLYRRGAVLFYSPEVVQGRPSARPPTLTDAYVFLRRWFKGRWAHYLAGRRIMGGSSPLAERRAETASGRACAAWPAPDHEFTVPRARAAGCGRKRPGTVTAIIPTLGRYPYIPGALSSLADQTIRPDEVLVVDQNPPEARRPEVYEPYRDMNVRVLWQEERGQSLARNAAIAEAQGEYVLLFEDDAVAERDLLEQHFLILQVYDAHVSTGVSLPPPPTDYRLPEEFRFPRVAQTFSSGNSLLTREALELVGGFDRNYDLGVNADMDFGTRLYLAGGVIIHNPHAAMIHYKAPMGGLRVYGHWWAHSNLGLRPFPPPTQLYYMLRFMTPRQRRERLLRFLGLAALGWEKRQSHARSTRATRAAHGLLGMPLMPYRIARSYSAARKLLAQGPRIPPPPRRPAPEPVGEQVGEGVAR